MGKRRRKNSVTTSPRKLKSVPSPTLTDENRSLLQQYALEAAIDTPSHFVVQYELCKPYLTIDIVVNDLLNIITAAAANHRTYLFHLIWDKFKNEFTIDHFRHQRTKHNLPLSAIAIATLKYPAKFVEFWQKFSADFRFEDLIEAPSLPEYSHHYLYTILQKIAKQDSTPAALKTIIQSILLMKVSFTEAATFFRTYPTEVKLKKFNPYDTSFVNIENVRYAIENSNTHPSAVLGEGGQGSVKLVHDENGIINTVKTQYGRLAEQNQDEITLLRRMGRLKGITERTFPTEKTIESKRFSAKTYKILPYIEGNTLYHELQTRNLSLIQLLIIAIKLCKLVDELHQQYQTIHGDLKPTNIIIRFPSDRLNDIIVELIDHGGAKALPAGHNEVKKYDSFGTDGYRAPEITEYKIFSYASDIYALGVIFEKNLQLPLDIFAQLKHMKHELRAYRPLLSEVASKLVNELKKLPNLDTDAIQVIASAEKPFTDQASGQSSSVPFHVTTAIAERSPLLQLIPRTTQSTLFYGDENTTVEYDGKAWTKIDSSIDFTSTENQYWVSLGCSSSRERLFFYAASEKMQKLCQEFHAKLLSSPPLSTFELLNAICQFVYNIPKLPGIQNVFGHKDITLDELIEKQELVCRHKTLIAIKLLTFLVSIDLLPKGIVRQYRSDITTKEGGSHTVATYRDPSTNQLWALDSNNCTLTEIDSFARSSRLHSLYGWVAISDMHKRLDFLDVYKPFVQGLQSQGQVNSFQFIRGASYHEARDPSGRPTIRIEFTRSISNRVFYSFINTLSLYGIEYSLKKMPDFTIEISHLSPRSFAKFNISNLHRSYKLYFEKFINNPELECISTIGSLLTRLNALNKTIRENLRACAKNGQLDSIEQIYDAFPASIHPTTETIAFESACFEGHFDVMRKLSNKRASSALVKGLEFALRKNHEEICNFLFSKITFSLVNPTMRHSLATTMIIHDRLYYFKLLQVSLGHTTSNRNLTAGSLLITAVKHNRIDFCQYLLTDFAPSISQDDIETACGAAAFLPSPAIKDLLANYRFYPTSCSLIETSSRPGVKLYEYLPSWHKYGKPPTQNAASPLAATETPPVRGSVKPRK